MADETVVDDEEVLSKSTSDIYHLKNPEDQFRKPDSEPACSISNHKVGSEGYRPIKLEDALDEGKEHCSKCVRWIKRTTDADLYKCELCGSLSITDDQLYIQLDVEDYPSPSDNVRVCSSCIGRLQRNINGENTEEAE
jgi:predicted RNA-binding Zn-ribbon protein involved in translation (DUF1610 family)